MNKTHLKEGNPTLLYMYILKIYFSKTSNDY